MADSNYILAFDTANESIAVAIADLADGEVALKASFEGAAHRASNTMLVPEIENLFENSNVSRDEIKCVAAGVGPGSFTGVRIALSTAKGIASALEVPLIGFNTLDAVAWRVWAAGIRGHIYVVADAMRGEIYPALFESTEAGIKRLGGNKVLKAQACAEEAADISGKVNNLTVAGDALHKYFDIFENLKIANQELWVPSPQSIVLAAKSEEKRPAGEVLPVYTRLSDAEEAEREKLADTRKKNLNVGVQNLGSVTFEPMDAKFAEDIAALESELMESDAWNSAKINSELGILNRSWWTAIKYDKIVGYAGAMQADNKMELLKIGVCKNFQKQGIAKKLISFVANDMRNLGAESTILEVRKSNISSQKFYEAIGLAQIAERKKYYSDGEDALIFSGPLPIITADVGGMTLSENENASAKCADKPVIFSVETSCDETACAITCNGNVVSDVVASQVDFHKRFGGVVPEIASRKHIEAICGVADECIERSNLNWADVDAVAATYAPGLVGALVVGMAFAKGLAFGLNKPFIIVNHLEGHIYANKLCKHDIALPAVASVISGGNTMLVHVKDWGNYATLGTTIDDAVGEAFDKLAKYLGLGYPGGPVISKLAKEGHPDAIKFPRAMLKSGDYDFSLSGLKTAVINYVDQHKNDENFNLPDLCASFEQAIIDVQVAKAKTAIRETGAKSFLFGGGVAANPSLRSAFEKMCATENVKMIMAPLSACGDNAAMIGLVANARFADAKFSALDADVSAHAPLDIAY